MLAANWIEAGDSGGTLAASGGESVTGGAEAEDDDDVVIARLIGPVVEVAAPHVEDPRMSADVARIVLGNAIARGNGGNLSAVFKDGGPEADGTSFSL